MEHYTGSDLGQSFRDYFTKEKKRITKILTELGCVNVQMSRQFYYYYGFFTTKTGQIYYFSHSDVRHFDDKRIMYRTAKSYTDYSGGCNQYIGENDLENIKLT